MQQKNEATLLLDMPIETDIAIKAGTPDIVIKSEKEKICILVYVSVCSDRNKSFETTEKLSNYKDLEIEIKRIWDMYMRTVPM